MSAFLAGWAAVWAAANFILGMIVAAVAIIALVAGAAGVIYGGRAGWSLGIKIAARRRGRRRWRT